MPSVTMSLGATLNMGNFESVRLDYSLTDDLRTGETPDQAYARVEAQVEKQLQRRMQDERSE